MFPASPTILYSPPVCRMFVPFASLNSFLNYGNGGAKVRHAHRSTYRCHEIKNIDFVAQLLF
jgi:hypothetical protein